MAARLTPPAAMLRTWTLDLYPVAAQHERTRHVPRNAPPAAALTRVAGAEQRRTLRLPPTQIPTAPPCPTALRAPAAKRQRQLSRCALLFTSVLANTWRLLLLFATRYFDLTRFADTQFSTTIRAFSWLKANRPEPFRVDEIAARSSSRLPASYSVSSPDWGRRGNSQIGTIRRLSER
jgi:hypothetical protein